MKAFKWYQLLITIALILFFAPNVIAKEKLPDSWGGQILKILVISDYSLGIVAKNTHLEKIGDAFFLVSIVVNRGDEAEWRADKEVWIPLDEVSQIIVFESVEEIEKLDEKWDKESSPIDESKGE